MHRSCIVMTVLIWFVLVLYVVHVIWGSVNKITYITLFGSIVGVAVRASKLKHMRAWLCAYLSLSVHASVFCYVSS